jgi:hypothetical protein
LSAAQSSEARTDLCSRTAGRVYRITV